MTNSEKLDLVLSKLDKLDILESEVQELKQHITNIEFTIEHKINKNIQLLIESQNNLFDKLNQSC